MKCVICKQGQPREGRATVTLHRGEATIILKGVPADVCDNCGEYYLSDEVAQHVLERAEKAIENGSEVEILRYAA